MANFKYTKALNKFLTGDIDVINDTIKASLIKEGVYLPDQDEDEFLSIIPEGAILSTFTLVGKGAVGGTFDADDDEFLSVENNYTGVAIVIWKDTNSPISSPLILYLDTADGLPVETTGHDIPVSWADDINKIFSL